MENKRNITLDIFRILAIIMVLSVHIKWKLSELPFVIDKIFFLGAYGVALYFVISGYFSYDSVRRCGSFKEYIKKKTVRILPMYYVSLVLTFIIGGLVLKIYPVSFEWIYHVFLFGALAYFVLKENIFWCL